MKLNGRRYIEGRGNPTPSDGPYDIYICWVENLYLFKSEHQFEMTLYGVYGRQLVYRVATDYRPQIIDPAIIGALNILRKHMILDDLANV